MSPRSKKIAAIMREKSRTAILSAALELFAKQGYSATTAEEIARKAGTSKGLIFTHFKTKENILLAIFEEQLELVLPRFFRDDDARPAEQKLVALIDSWVDVIKSQPLLVRLSLQLNLDDEYRKIIRNRKTMQYYQSFLSRMTRTVREAGSDNPELDTYVLMFFFDGIVANYTVAPELFPIDAIKDRLVESMASRWKKPPRTLSTPSLPARRRRARNR